MPTIIDNIEIDEANLEFKYAADFVRNTNKLVYITGKAGTGKTTFLKYIRETTQKRTVVLAPTGVAAINARGQTIYSFFHVPFSVFVPNDKRLRTKADKNDNDKSTIYDYFHFRKEDLAIIRGIELLIIDEISMVRCDILDLIDRLLRVFRNRPNEPFGGVQVVLIGDTFQLPPVAQFDVWEILRVHYESPYFFSAKVIRENTPVYIELKKIYRQKEQVFIDLLNRVRVGEITPNEIGLLNSKYNPLFVPTNNDNYIVIETTNKIVENTNLTKLSELPGEIIKHEAAITGNFPENIMPTDRVLQLKKDAQIMFIKNDWTKGIYNGQIAKISSLTDTRIHVNLTEGESVSIERQTWDNIRYKWNAEEEKVEEEILGTFTQYPIKLAWSITVHKSQGLTFDKVIANLSKAFAPGQVYVALSRCTTFNGLVLKTKIGKDAIKTAPEVLDFAKNETPETLIVKELNSGKADLQYKKAKEAVEQFDFGNAYLNFISAIKLRNDIETENFKKYFVTTASRLASFKMKFFAIQSKLSESERHINNLSRMVVDSKEDLLAKEQKLWEQNNSVRLLLDKLKEHEVRNADLQTKLSQIKESLRKAEVTIQKQKESVKNLEVNILKRDIEIDRLNKLKWYQKLVGKE